MVEIIIASLSLIVVIVISVLLFINAKKVKDDLSTSMNDIVDQVNNNQYYIYQFDKKQDDQLTNVTSNIDNVVTDVNSLKDYVSKNYVSKSDLAKGVATDITIKGAANIDNKDSSSLTLGPNGVWGGKLRVGAMPNRNDEMAQLISTNNNIHLDAGDNTRNAYINYYKGNKVVIGNPERSTDTIVYGSMAIDNKDGSSLSFGPNRTWGGKLRVGAMPNVDDGMAQIISTNNNLHLDAGDNNRSTYVNFYKGNKLIIGNPGKYSDTTVYGKLCINDTCLSESELKQLKSKIQ